MAAALGLCVAGLCCRYGPMSLLRLASLRLRWPWLLIVAAVLQAALVAGGAGSFWYSLGGLILIGAFGLLNAITPGVALASGGAVLNLAVMLAHGGRMPVHPGVAAWLGGTALAVGEALAGTKGVGASADSPLLLLGDWLPLPGAVSGVALWSPGDLLLLAGILVLLVKTTRGGLAYDDATGAQSPG
jgi:hypothetical protein